MVKRISIVVLTLLVAFGILGWFNRGLILTQMALTRAKANQIAAAPTQPIEWQRGPDTAARPSSARPPNIIFILYDDLGYNDISTFGGGVAGGRVPTPNIDRLAESGAIFSQAYSGTSTCAPSRAMLLTGRYPTRTGFEFTPTPDGMSRIRTTLGNLRGTGALPKVQRNPDAAGSAALFRDQGLPGSEITIAEVLQDQNYHTVHIGKWHLGRRADFLPNAQGFDESLLMLSGLYLPEDDPGVVNAKLDHYVVDQFHWAGMSHAAAFNDGAPFKPGGYLTDWWTDESLRVIEVNKNRPFFLYLAHWAPHSPLQATQEDYEAVGAIEPHELRVYAAMIRAVDRSVGRIVEKLEDEGLAENTIILLSSDNGGAGYLGLPDVNAPFRGWKSTLFEGGIRVPMFMKWPQRIAPGTIIDTPVTHIDLFPTLASASGAELPSDRIIDGQNLLPAATGLGTIKRFDEALFWQSGTYQVVRSGDWKLQIDGRQDKVWLFNLATDPTEQTNLAELRQDAVSELKALLGAHHRAAVDPLHPHRIYSPVLVDKTADDRAVASDEYVIWPN